MEDDNKRKNRVYFFDDIEDEITTVNSKATKKASFNTENLRFYGFDANNKKKKFSRSLSDSIAQVDILRKWMKENKYIRKNMSSKSFYPIYDVIGLVIAENIINGHIVELPNRTGYLYVRGFKAGFITDETAFREDNAAIDLANKKHRYSDKVKYGTKWSYIGIPKMSKYAYDFSAAKFLKDGIKDKLSIGIRYSISTAANFKETIMRLRKNKFIDK